MTDKTNILQATCPHCGYLNTFNKQILCKENRDFIKSKKEKGLDKLRVSCQNPTCGKDFLLELDCGELL